MNTVKNSELEMIKNYLEGSLSVVLDVENNEHAAGYCLAIENVYNFVKLAEKRAKEAA